MRMMETYVTAESRAPYSRRKNKLAPRIEDVEENTNEDQRRIQFLMAFVEEVGAVFSVYVLERLVEPGAGVADGSRVVLRERCPNCSLPQTRNENRGH
jgi:hypothetical protein